MVDKVNIEVDTVYPLTTVGKQTDARPIIKVVLKKAHVFDANMQKKLLKQYDLDSKTMS